MLAQFHQKQTVLLVVKNLAIKTEYRFIVRTISFTLERGQTLALIGPSGSGKTTLIKAILGMTKDLDVSGTIHLDNQIMQNGNQTRIPLPMRKFGYVPQNLALWPHLTVLECLRLSLHFAHGKNNTKSEGWLNDLIRLCGLFDLLSSTPKKLSRGEQQRLALARALMSRPKLLILDEPFSALDIVAKSELISIIKNCQDIFGLAMVFISHDLKEAFAVAHHLLILIDGNQQWLGEKNDLNAYHFPKTWNPFLIDL